MRPRWYVRAVLAFLIVVSTGVIAADFVTANVVEARSEIKAAEGTGEEVIPPRKNATVVISDDRVGGKLDSALVAYRPNGSVWYYNETYSNYQDVDPVEGKRTTVQYVAAERIDCASKQPCSRMVLESVNLTTGDVTRLWSTVTTARGPGAKTVFEYHDIDHINGSRYLVADIMLDRVFVVDVETGLITWEWAAKDAYNFSTGGVHPGDWTHLNDVEVINDTRYMASLRNQDRVVFLSRKEGLLRNWTLGAENNYSILYEQHNPDYIPEERGGPAVLVADSENDRVVEYQRVNGTWKRTWQWRDDRLQWPRDADRLPNGNNLIVDSHGNRVIEVNPAGEIVWQTTTVLPYDAERLGTGDESATGEAAATLGLESRVTEETRANERPFEALAESLRRVVPTKILNAVLFVLPVWITPQGAVSLAVLILSLLSLLAAELYWSPISIALRRPWRIER